MKLSKKTEYALLALHYLRSAGSERAVSAREIGERLRLPASLLAKVLQRLRTGGLVEASTGVRGGYRLTTGLSQVTLAQVIDSVEGKPFVLRCHTARGGCEMGPACAFRRPMLELSRRVYGLLARTTLIERE